MLRYVTSTKHQSVLVLFNSDWPVKAYRLTPTKRPRSHNQAPRAQRREISYRVPVSGLGSADVLQSINRDVRRVFPGSFFVLRALFRRLRSSSVLRSVGSRMHAACAATSCRQAGSRQFAAGSSAAEDSRSHSLPVRTYTAWMWLPEHMRTLVCRCSWPSLESCLYAAPANR